MPFQSVIGRFVPLSFLSSRIYDILAEKPSREDLDFAVQSAHFTLAKKDAQGYALPQSIAHRGWKAYYPENTLVAFHSAVLDAGADGLETDIHLTSDDVVVLSHDATLKRCFGHEEKIADVEYSYVKTLRTLRKPEQPMPRLDELLTWLAEDAPGREDVWLLLDIKMDNPPDLVMRRIAETIASVAPHSKKSWSERIVMGVWAQKYLPLCKKYLPEFPIAYIGFSTGYAQRFLGNESANVGFNMLTQSLYLDPGFIDTAHAAQRPVFAWTVNQDDWMRWTISKGLDAVITDDPARFNQVKKDWVLGQTSTKLSVRKRMQAAWLRIMILLMSLVLKWREVKQK